MQLWAYARKRIDGCGKNAIAKARVYEQFVVEAIDILGNDCGYAGSVDDLAARLVYLLPIDDTIGHQNSQFRAVINRLKKQEVVEDSGGCLKVKVFASGVFWPAFAPEVLPACFVIFGNLLLLLSGVAAFQHEAEVVYELLSTAARFGWMLEAVISSVI